MASFFKARVADFLSLSNAQLLMHLTTGESSRGLDLKADQHAAWIDQAEILRTSLKHVVEQVPSALSWGLLLEFEIPGRRRRLDAVILDGYGIIAIEFKIGAVAFLSGDRWQLREYCWDVRDFHRESEGLTIAPILVATAAPMNSVAAAAGQFEDQQQKIFKLRESNGSTLATAISAAHEQLEATGRREVPLEKWDESQPYIISTVVEEALRLFSTHDVREIIHSHADNTDDALNALLCIVQESRSKFLRSICFVTGVPGAGKTLVGLRAAYSSAMLAAAAGPIRFASGNNTLLNVLNQALTRNRAKDKRLRRKVAHELDALPVNVHQFAEDHLLDQRQRPPIEQVVVFDEAQRVWTKEKVETGIQKKVRRKRLSNEQGATVLSMDHSEPDLLLRVMERCPGWCVIIALVGGGQEIHDGEAGLEAWKAALLRTSAKWTIWAAPPLADRAGVDAAQELFPSDPGPGVDFRPVQELYLSVSKRTIRAEQYANWVNWVVSGQPAAAAAIRLEMKEFPIFLVRDLSQAKRLVREYAGTGRVGLVASSGAVRLRADGLELKREFRGALKYPDWFLNEKGDIRSSDQLEIAATEFECQGLELDWTVVCWGGDFVFDLQKSKWLTRELWSSRKWRAVTETRDAEFIRNKYRVILTRARFGIVIYVPAGDPNDSTRQPIEFEATVTYLMQCGLKPE